MSEATAESAEVSLRRAIHDSNQDPIPRNIALQVRLGADGTDALLQRLYREMEIYAPLLARDRQVVQFTLEGDGCTQLNETQHADLQQSFEQHFSLARSLMASPELRGSPPAVKAPPDCDVLGLGLGAISHFGACQTMNAGDLQTYSSALDVGRLPIVHCHWDEPAA